MKLICARCERPINGEILATRRFMRHGKTEMNMKNICVGSIDEPINERGKQQADEAARMFLASGEIIDLIVSSLMVRHLQTAGILSRVLGVPIRINERLRERNVGELQGSPETPESDAQLLRCDYQPTGAVSLTDFEAETKAFLRDCRIYFRFPRNTLFVTSGFRMLTLIKLIRGWNVEKITRYTPPANCRIITFHVGPACACDNRFFEEAI